MAGTILAIVVLGLMLLGALAVVVVIVLVVGGALFEARSHARRRRPSSGYRRQLLAAERGHHRRRRRRGRNPHGITVFLDTLPPGTGRRSPDPPGSPSVRRATLRVPVD